MEMCVLKESDKLLDKMQNKYTIIQEKEEMLFLSFLQIEFSDSPTQLGNQEGAHCLTLAFEIALSIPPSHPLILTHTPWFPLANRISH